MPSGCFCPDSSTAFLEGEGEGGLGSSSPKLSPLPCLMSLNSQSWQDLVQSTVPGQSHPQLFPPASPHPSALLFCSRGSEFQPSAPSTWFPHGGRLGTRP